MMINSDRSELNVFVDNAFNRLAEKRDDHEWLQQALSSTDTSIIGVWKNRCLVEQGQLKLASINQFNLDTAGAPILLGEIDGGACFALDLGQSEHQPDTQAWEFEDLRTIGTLFDTTHAALGAYAQAMVFWHRSHRHCGFCGGHTISLSAGHARECAEKGCQTRSFPRTDPAVIVAPFHQNKILLGRQATWPQGRYSTIAGFVEPGESLEMAVRREVAEETGHHVNTVEYLSSQPWPFPSSQMLGFIASIDEHPIHQTDEELEDVRWFTRNQIMELERTGPKLLPPPISIAYRLVEHWFNLDSEQPLERLL